MQYLHRPLTNAYIFIQCVLATDGPQSKVCEPPLHTAHSFAHNITAVYGEL